MLYNNHNKARRKKISFSHAGAFQMSSSAKRVTDESFLADLIGRLVPIYHPIKIYLFGSRAKGNARQDSDYDVLILVNDDVPKELKEAREAYTALWGIKVPVDIVVWTKSDFENSGAVPNSLPAKVLREGRTLYVA